MPETRPLLTDPDVLETLAHPVRLDLLTYLIADGPATASQCARAVGDTPSNCSYHLRMLARPGLVEPVASSDGRTRPWRATITGFAIEPDPDPATPGGRGAAAVMAASVASDQRHLRDYLEHRDEVSPAWREADVYAGYTLRITPAELQQLTAQLDGLIRPLIAALREDPPAGAELVTLGLSAFPHQEPRWNRPLP